jgi:HTH-type transcriptional regulator/antitoxin HigA
MATRKTGRKTPDTYLERVKEFPLTHIRDDAHLRRAEAVMHRLLEEDLDEGAQEYLEVLTDLVEKYEDEHVPIPDASEADVLRLLMDSNGLNQTQLSKAVRIAQSTISSVLKGTRRLTRDQAVALGKHFHVSPAVFFSV